MKKGNTLLSYIHEYNINHNYEYQLRYHKLNTYIYIYIYFMICCSWSQFKSLTQFRCVQKAKKQKKKNNEMKLVLDMDNLLYVVCETIYKCFSPIFCNTAYCIFLTTI